MIMDLVLNFGAVDSPEASDSVFRLRRTFRPPFGCGCSGACACASAGDFGFDTDGCLSIELDDCRSFGCVFVFVMAAPLSAARAIEELVRRGGEEPFGVDFGVSKGFVGTGIPSEVSFVAKGFSPLSLGRSDSVEPLFFSDRDEGLGLSESSNRASSICRNAIWPFKSSSRVFH
jgi:hypothetical protein